jgi:hypothetical protein
MGCGRQGQGRPVASILRYRCAVGKARDRPAAGKARGPAASIVRDKPAASKVRAACKVRDRRAAGKAESGPRPLKMWELPVAIEHLARWV